MYISIGIKEKEKEIILIGVGINIEKVNNSSKERSKLLNLDEYRIFNGG